MLESLFNNKKLKNYETTKSCGFSKILKVKKICFFFKSVLSSRSDNSGPGTRDHVKSSQMRNKTLLIYNSKGFSFMPEQVYIFFYGSQI